MTLAVLLLLASPVRAAFPGVERSSAPIIVIYPQEGATIAATGGEFFLGSVSDPKARLTINGTTVAVHSNGAFLGWLPVDAGSTTFRFNLELKAGAATLTRTVFVPPSPLPLPPKPPVIDESSLWPAQDLELVPGDLLLARMRASVGQEARFRLGKGEWQPMREANPVLGIYEGSLLIGHEESSSDSAVEYQLGGRSGPLAPAKGKVSAHSGPPRVAVVRSAGPVPVRTGPGEEEFFSAYPGTRFVAAGRQGEETKMALSAGHSGWIETKHLEFLPAGAHPPRARTDAITVRSADDGSTVRIGLTDRIPFQIEEADDLKSISVRLHYAWADTNWIVHKSADPLIEDIRFTQETADTVLVKILLAPGETLWGWQASMEPGALKIELRRPPFIAPAPASALKNRVIFLDPGHGPAQSGAIGPLGTREADVNFALA